MKTHDEGIADAKCRCPEGAAAPQNYLGDLIVCIAIRPVELEELFALRDPHLFGIMGQIQCFLSMDLDLVGDDEIGLRDVSGSQELLGTGATRSALSVVIPLDVDGHKAPLFGLPLCCLAILWYRLFLPTKWFNVASRPTAR